MSIKLFFAPPVTLRFIVLLLITGLGMTLFPGTAAFGAKKLPSAFLSPVRGIFEDIDGGGIYECQNEMAELMDLIGDAWNDLPQEAQDQLMRSLNRRYPCGGGGWGWIDDLGDFVKDVGDWVEDFGECAYAVLSDVNDIDYETLLDAVYENGDACPWKDKERLECSVRKPRASDPNWSCVRTSRFSGSCISSADLADAFVANSGNRCLELDTDAQFCEGESAPYDMTVYLTTDDVELDCNGAAITGMSGGAGIRTPYERSVSNIQIRSCHIQDTDRYGIDLKRFFRGAELDGDMQGHSNIDFEDVSITDPGQIGVYVGQNSRNVSFRDLDIRRARVAGIYLEAGSTHTLVSGGSIRGTQPKDSSYADSGAGIAIDSSQYNTIERVTFEDNDAGDIKLYKNCGENFGQVCPIRRPLSASHNVIRFNDFNDDVSVASRQFKFHAFGWCAGIDVAGYWRDHSSDNLIYSNRFHDTKLDVQDGPNKICGNDFLGGKLELGKSQPTGFIDQPVEINGIVVENAFSAGSRVDVRALGVFSELDFFDNRDLQATCLDLRDTCTGADSSSLVEVARYWECVDLRNECSALTTSRSQSAAQACGVMTSPTWTVESYDNIEVVRSVGMAKPTPLPTIRSAPTSLFRSSRMPVNSWR